MKIYCIKLDTMQYDSNVPILNEIIQGDIHRMVSGCYTLSACAMQFTGCLTSQLEGGFGHWLWQDRLNASNEVEWPWQDKLVFHYLKTKGYKLHLRNWTEFILHFGLQDVFDSVSSILDGTDDGYIFPCRWISEQAIRCTLSQPPVSDEDEIAYIKKIQKDVGDNFYFINYNHHHVACQLGIVKTDLIEKQKIVNINIQNIIKHWDFNEPDSLFWIYGDHGPWYHPDLDKFPLPFHFYTWAIIKDNTQDKIKAPKRISITDFVSHMKHKIDKTEIQNKDVFLSEDGRDAYSPKSMSTAIACSFTGDTMSLLEYHLMTNEWAQFVCDETGVKQINEINVILQDSIRANFNWVL